MKIARVFLAICLSAFCFADSSMVISKKEANLVTKEPENIQVLLEKDADQALLEVRGPYYIFNPDDGSRVGSGLLGKRFIVHAVSGGLKWGEIFPGIHQIYVIPRSPDTAILVNGIQYEGAIAVFQVGNRISIINDVDIEIYLKSILTPQFSYPLETEAMAAVAILARTEAYYHVKMNEDKFWHVDKDDVNYMGSAIISLNSHIEKAVESTKHMILVHRENGKSYPFIALWNEHCGGKTASYKTIFRKETYGPQEGVDVPHAAYDRKDTHWAFRISKMNLANLFNLSRVSSLELFLDKDSKKVYGIRLKDGDRNHDVDFFTFQNRVGKDRVISNDFAISLKNDEILFSGYGKGHGVGMCLYTASTCAQNGEDAVQILTRFFPGSNMINLTSKETVLEEIVQN